ncbi:bile acid:sodium symporter family protein [Demequina aurantiaca]|uniref:bile acid:sodium symporter family protein n=1 Tax=Demequina aurantiaca TaxID=676200 RepID=UPI000785529C|nr:bile acid:sodium symporter [Demequina aurantiaca]
MIDDVLLGITKVGMLAFVVAGMFAMGLKLTVASILGPLKNARLVIMLLIANFVVVPGIMVLVTKVLPMDDATATALILVACCAGAPFLPTLAKLSKSDPAFAVGGMVLLMVVTVVYAPIVVPLLVTGAEVSPGDIASSLVVLMLIPLAIGLFIRARYEGSAATLAKPVNQISTVGLALGIVAGIIVNWSEIIGSVGSWIFIGTLILLAVGYGAGYLAGFGMSASDRRVTSFATAQRNISAALVIAVSLDGDVIVRTLVAALVVPIVLIWLAAELGKRSGGTSETTVEAVEA